MEFFTLSCINNAFWAGVIFLWYQKQLYKTHELLTALVVFLIVFLSPAGAAFVTAQFRQRGWIARFVDWLGFQSARWNTTAWDFKLSETDPVWVIVTLKNGDRVHGLFGSRSFAGDAGPSADLYLERTVIRKDDDSFQENPNQGAWIACDQIAIIEFAED